MNLIFIILSLIFTTQPIDINRAALEEVLTLPIPEEDARALYEWRLSKGEFKSIYELRELKCIDGEEFERIKPLIEILPMEEKRAVSRYIEDVQERLASEESPSEAAVDKWEELAVSPMDINTAGIDDILLLDRVNLVDAASLVRYRKSGGRFRYQSDLKRATTYYAFRNMRNFVTFKRKEIESLEFHGFGRIQIEDSDRFDIDWNNPVENMYYLESSISNLLPDSITYEKLIRAEWSDSDIDSLRKRLEEERDELASLSSVALPTMKLRLTLGPHLKFGIQKKSELGDNELLKGYFGVEEMGYLRKLYVGNYRLTFSQGLFMDNTDETLSRIYDRPEGLFGDLTSTREFVLKGIAGEVGIGRYSSMFFYSNSKRDGIENPDGTINSYIITVPRMKAFKDVFREELYGGRVCFDLSNILKLPLATRIGFSGMNLSYDKRFNPDARTLDIPFDKDNLTDPNYTRMWSGKSRNIYGIDARTVIRNLSFEGEWAGTEQGSAFILKSRVQYNTLYLLVLLRHYGISYDNPYSRAFMEQKKFDDTMLEKEYRLLDPLYFFLSEYPAPKAEEGLYIELRNQVTRNFTFTKVYVDIWRNVGRSLPNLRFQGEIEWRPIFPLRLRLKQKIQRKYLYKSVEPTVSRTFETTLRSFATLTQRDYINAEIRIARVQLTPTVEYGSNSLIDGGYLSSSYEHRFSDRLSILGGFAVWSTNGLSQWIFEDTGIDFLYGSGRKFYITIKDRLSDNIYIRFKLRDKLTEIPHTGLYEGDYRIGEEEIHMMRDFVDKKRELGGELQLIFWW
ncbi:helix-hairpin-helix domain-containing protein [candidate division WOR-3 bacterium]|nr:helix-hairpin-helix domain-containing protein [candidate division WOR-3 bacterium]